MGRETGVCNGVGGSQHLHKGGFYSNGIQGGIVPIAAGLAFAHKIQKKKNISVVFIGDGTLGEGVVYEALNIASKWELPMLFVLEDNKYSQSTQQEETLAGNILDRPISFGIESFKTSTWDWENLLQVSEFAIESIRLDSKPRFLQIETFRLKAHSKGDDNRPIDKINKFSSLDPLNIFLDDLSDSQIEWVNSIRDIVKVAIGKAEKSDYLDSVKYLNTGKWSATEFVFNKIGTSRGIRFVDALNRDLVEIMSENPEVYLLGEDVESPYGGAFKVSKELSNLFPGRVKNTPISEACIVGMGGGIGLLGLTPIIEIMFGDFIGLAFDQIVNHIAKFREMYGNDAHSNVIIRTPMGGGRGYGPTHSQTLDKHFLGIPGIKVIALNNYLEPIEIYGPLVNKKLGPALVIENKIMYGGYLNQYTPYGFSFNKSNNIFPDILVTPDSNEIDITLIGYGGTSNMLIQAAETLFEKHEIFVQILIISQLYPLNISSYLKKLREAKGIIIVEEGQGFGGFGAELISQIYENNQNEFKVRRIFAEEKCIPSAGVLEKEVLPSIEKIILSALSIKNHD
jgi:2-oxoisovalerate dehydrogenase E1 component